MRVSDQQRFQSFATDVGKRLENFLRIQQEMAEGKRLFKPSEDVTAARQALTAKSALEENRQYVRNIEDGNNLVAAASTQLQNVIDILNQIDALAVAADNAHMTEQYRQNAATEMDQQIEAMISSINGVHGDRYLFGGHQTTSAPFTITRNESGRISGLEANEETVGGRIYRRIDRNEDVHVNVSGDRLFQPIGAAGTDEDLIFVVTSLRDVIANNNTPPEGEEETLSNDVLREHLAEIRDRITTEQTYLGSVAQRLNSKLDHYREYEIALTEKLEDAEGVEMTDLVSRLAIEENVYDSLMAINSRILSRSLVDYLG